MVRKMIGRAHEAVDNAGFARRVARIVDDPELTFGPGFLERPSRTRRRADVMAPLNHDAGNIGDHRRIVQQLAFLKEEVLKEEARANTSEGHRFGGIFEIGEQIGVGQKCGDIAFPKRPLAPLAMDSALKTSSLPSPRRIAVP